MKQYNLNILLAQWIEHTFCKGKYENSNPLWDIFILIEVHTKYLVIGL